MSGALLAGFFVVRVAFVEAFAAKDPATAAAVWAGHPAALLESGLAQVGDMAAAGRPVDQSLVDRLISASAKAPLAPEPFLVRGVDAQVSGNRAVALQSYLAARERNPRAVAPRYFLADLYLKAGRTEPGLAEISALARLVPQSLPNVAKYLAAYARTHHAPELVAEHKNAADGWLAPIDSGSADGGQRVVLAPLEPGDVVIMGKRTMHESMANSSDRMRLCCDFRFFGEQSHSTKHYLDIAANTVVAPAAAQ